MEGLSSRYFRLSLNSFKVAESLAELPKTSAAFERGEVSYSKVRAMTPVATPDNDNYLLNIARRGTAAHVERSVVEIHENSDGDPLNIGRKSRSIPPAIRLRAFAHDGRPGWRGQQMDRNMALEGLLRATSPTRTAAARAASGRTIP